MPPPTEQLVLLVGEINGKLDVLLDQHKDYGKRIGVLERDRMRLFGAIGGVSALLTWLNHDKLPMLFTLLH